MRQVALCLDMQTKYDVAESLYRDALESLEVSVGLEHGETSYVREDLASMFEKQGRTTEAAEVRKRFGTLNHEAGTSSASNPPKLPLLSREVSVASSSGRNEIEMDEVDGGGGPVSYEGRHTVVVSAPDSDDERDCSSNGEHTYKNDDSEGNVIERSRPQMSLKGKEICYD
ncbi:hypothetical protein IFR04_002181 [Cadophora malorum]|uniref:Uncharacterized protein n=1 Tax=Cadophora malorum TaxID=108018 RepID=A0A8H7WGT1_9HELO|nr:hypothetical protein IFR04_002181 [Cadophora malorum]